MHTVTLDVNAGIWCGRLARAWSGRAPGPVADGWCRACRPCPHCKRASADAACPHARLSFTPSGGLGWTLLGGPSLRVVDCVLWLPNVDHEEAPGIVCAWLQDLLPRLVDLRVVILPVGTMMVHNSLELHGWYYVGTLRTNHSGLAHHAAAHWYHNRMQVRET